MKAASLSVDKVEFIHIKVETNSDFDGEFSSEFKQLEFPFKGVTFRRRMSLQYDKRNPEDPKSFVFGLNLMIAEDSEDPENVSLPYNVDVKAIVYMKYESDQLEGMERFRAVRATGYTILYGAIREMVSNLTARAPHGMWSLPSANFNTAAHEEAQRDEERRQELIAKKLNPVVKKTAKRVKKEDKA
ncbi:hypothetical protein ACNFCI_06610 [Pseudomonas sp. NY15356]|uniref:hypothetical protein n=1 Tax=unclassified Pseudomonas TaxID=196821 RepID=UPI003A8C3BE3